MSKSTPESIIYLILFWFLVKNFKLSARTKDARDTRDTFLESVHPCIQKANVLDVLRSITFHHVMYMRRKHFPQLLKNLKRLSLKTSGASSRSTSCKNCYWSLCKSSQIYPFAAACIVSSTNSANTGIKLHIIFDQGSQHSYLSQRAKDALNLNTVTKERLLINAFGAKEEEFKTCDKVEVLVGSLFDKFEMKIDTFVVDNICNPLEKHDLYEIQSKYPHLSNI